MGLKGRKIRTKQIIIRMTPREHTAAHRLADREERTLAELVRWLLDRREAELSPDATRAA
jgi:hypothetical protein